VKGGHGVNSAATMTMTTTNAIMIAMKTMTIEAAQFFS